MPGIDWRGRTPGRPVRRGVRGAGPMAFPASRPTACPSTPATARVSHGDAWVLQAMPAPSEPASVIEVGAGYSSLVTARVNREFLGGGMRFTAIDP